MNNVVDMEQLDETGIRLQNYIEDNIISVVRELQNLFKGAQWSGPAKETFVEIYSKDIEKFNGIVEMLEKFAVYMRFVAEKYDEVNIDSEEEFNRFAAEVSDIKKIYEE